MPIDDCEHSISTLNSKILPGYLRELRKDMKRPIRARVFCKDGLGTKWLLKEHFGNRDSDFSGCYVFLGRNNRPFYVGISRGVVGRLHQHMHGISHYDASLAFTMARKKMKMEHIPRAACLRKPSFKKQFELAKRALQNAKVATVEIENPLELYLFEAYCAMKFDTSKWNTFRTH